MRRKWRPNEVILLEELITYDKLKTLIADSGRSYDLAVIDKAYALAEKAHRGVARKSGEPYITHPLNVAALLIDLGLDTEPRQS